MRDPQKWLNDPRRPRPAPVEYAGKWVAWDKPEKTIVGVGVTAAEARQSAITSGHTEFVLQKVPRPDVVFIGGLRR